MHSTIFAAFLGSPGTPFWMATAGLAVLVIGLWAVRNDIAQARGLDKLGALANVCFAAPLAVFGAMHLSAGKELLLDMVPRYMPMRVFWVYFVGIALIAASLSIATKIFVRWSGRLVGIMMFLFVAMLYFPSAFITHNRFTTTIVFRELSFGSGGWVLAGIAMGGLRGQGRYLIIVGRVLIACAAIFFGVQHFLHPMGLPVVPLQKQMPAWVPIPTVIDYATGAFLIVAGVCFLFAKKTRTAAGWLGAWILLMLAAIYLPVMLGALANPAMDVKIEGLNYYADTLLFCGTILSLARAMTFSDPVESTEAAKI